MKASAEALNLDAFTRRLVDVMPRFIMALLRAERSLISRGVITVPQVWTLLCLEETGSCSMHELARALRLTPPTVTSLVGRLVKFGLVGREPAPGDRRVVRAAITVKGAALLKNLRRDKRKAARRLFAAVPPPERTAFLRVLENMVEKDHGPEDRNRGSAR